MANEDKKDFNAMLHRATDMPRIQLVTDAATVQKYGGARMYFAPAADYDAVMKRVPFGKVLTVGKIREYSPGKTALILPTPSLRAFLYPFRHGPAPSGRRTKRLTGAR